MRHVHAYLNSDCISTLYLKIFKLNVKKNSVPSPQQYLEFIVLYIVLYALYNRLHLGQNPFYRKSDKVYIVIWNLIFYYLGP